MLAALFKAVPPLPPPPCLDAGLFAGNNSGGQRVRRAAIGGKRRGDDGVLQGHDGKIRGVKTHPQKVSAVSGFSLLLLFVLLLVIVAVCSRTTIPLYSNFGLGPS